ncbi:MAG: hypothetical protein UU80_C0011G0023 [candidate division WWE3 bacterium GW2011_GWA1_41_8]|uniref:CBM-cenC domain-containing protein n=1 Tax=candidate division WWE3 bacterium GW2011_GWA1_41_8 TaxID=1619103 RepID=A0A0G0XCW2_UNCKA|nr:MAG: hypothetical protein UU80_C0011G0023 [candidate division WWE3 bacterium GW2011_GWA1_41_8]
MVIILTMPRTKLFLSTSFLFLFLSLPFKISAADTTAPTTTYVQSPATPDGNNGWYRSIVQFNLSATDLESGVKEINYQINSSGWNKVLFSGTLNQAPNPSFEDAGGTPSGVALWDATEEDAQTTYTQDTSTYDPGHPSSSAKTTTTSSGWHGINNKVNFAVAEAYSNMTASVSLKTQNVSEDAFFKVYAVSQNGSGEQTYTLIGQSSTITGTNDWTRLSLNFVVNAENAIGVYLDIGLNGPGTVWSDAVVINSSTISANTSFSVATDSVNHTVVFYSVDNADNVETYSCEATIKNCVTFKLDQTPPGNWMNSGAYREIPGPSNHHLYTYVTVEDLISGLSALTSKYQYQPDDKSEFGIHSDLLQCSSEWQANNWAALESGTPNDGDTTADLLTQLTDYCNSDWKICKTVKFFAEDMAGNNSTKNLCINGPWIKVRGKGIVRSNNIIDMLSEPEEPNTDGLIEAAGSTINFFTSERGWKVTNSPVPQTRSYDDYLSLVTPPTPITGTLPAATGSYLVDGNYTLSVPNNYDSNTFDQIVFVNGNLTIDNDIKTHANTTALFVVKGDVLISKTTDNLEIGLIADGDIYTAYDMNIREVSRTLSFRGIYSADHFYFQRTLQGTNNNYIPSEDFTYEPKYAIQMKNYFSKSSVKWIMTE